MNISFSKYQGTGNDFILVDNRDGSISLAAKQIAKLCDRRFGIGADGLMELQKQEGYDFKMVYYNSDGKEGSMCGNGGRCITQFAFDIGIEKNNYEFIAVDGPHTSYIDDDHTIHLKMKDINQVENYSAYTYLNTGSPHVVKQVQNLADYDVVAEGKKIRYNDHYKEHGVNVNFVEVIEEDLIFVRTYERGVEDETYSCGTGVTAAALVNSHNDAGFNHVDVKTLGGRLYVEYDKTGEEKFENIWLCGPGKLIFKGSVELP